MESGKRKPKAAAMRADTVAQALAVIPPVGECLAPRPHEPAFAKLNRRWMRTLVRRAIEELRREVIS